MRIRQRLRCSRLFGHFWKWPLGHGHACPWCWLCAKYPIVQKIIPYTGWTTWSPANVGLVHVDDCIGRRLPGKEWTIGYAAPRGTSMWRVRERPGDNSWEDVTPDMDGMIWVEV